MKKKNSISIKLVDVREREREREKGESRERRPTKSHRHQRKRKLKIRGIPVNKGTEKLNRIFIPTSHKLITLYANLLAGFIFLMPTGHL